ncbi:UNVERIFIED_CONTAM: hypothetical protein Slati_2552000 [Sesamum latifolium]|uniref:Uncharacterized protein n=1 Tax=Sesamum latifolium TaxID=2727402 RepID=A0AAW2VRN6_9LAMI
MVDISSSMHSTRSRSIKSNSEKDSRWFLDRNSSSDSRRNSSSNGSSKHPYSSFTRSHRERNHDREKEKFLSEDIWEHYSSDPFASISTSRIDRSAFKRSQSLVSRKAGEVLPRRVEDSRNSISSQSSSNGVLSGEAIVVAFRSLFLKRIFHHLELRKLDMTGIRRVLSPGLTSSVQSLPIGKSVFLGGEKWTSALAEAPLFLPMMAWTTLIFNRMWLDFQLLHLEPLVQQLPDKIQRLEELAIKQSKQLIPVTPSMPKPSGLGSGDKSKQPRIAVRTGEMIVASKGVNPQSHSPHLSNQSHIGQVRSDSPSSSHKGKFLVLKPGRENGVKDAAISTGDANCRVLNAQLPMAPSKTASMSLSNSMVPALGNKVAALSLSSRSTVDKRSSQSLAQSRSEFFKLMRRKTTHNATTSHSDSSSAVSSPSAQTSGEINKEGHTPIRPCHLENGTQMICNGNEHDIPENSHKSSDIRENNSFVNGAICPDEEEAAFLRSLGWEENGGEDEGLTEEEINAFYQEYMNRQPSLEVCGSPQPKCLASSEFQSAIPGIACSESSSSESEA